MKTEKENQPYEKFNRFGAQNLSDTELLAIIIRTGTQSKTALDLAQEVLNLNGNRNGLLGLHHLDVKELSQIKGIGKVKATKLKCLAEISERISAQKAYQKLDFRNPMRIAAYYMERTRHLETEQVRLILLDQRCRLIDDPVISTGTVNCSLISTREIYLKALKGQAVHIMLLHNHPSGDPTPSKEDLKITSVVRECGQMLQVPLLDHIIIGDGCYTSFAEKRLL